MKNRMGSELALTIAALFCLMFMAAATAWAAPTLALVPSGDGVFTLRADGLEGAGALDITVVYDAASLTAPRVTQGPLIAGAVMVVNDTVAGKVRMGIVRTTPVQGNGVIVTLAFTRTGASSGRIASMSANLANMDGRPLPVLVQVTNPPETASPDGAARVAGGGGHTETPAPGQAPPAAVPPVVSGGIAATPSSPQQQGEQKEQAPDAAQPAAEPAGSGAPAAVAARSEEPRTKPAEEPRKKIQERQSVLERFREFKGERAMKPLLALFAREDMKGFSQKPAIALSDGKAKITMTVSAPASGGMTPDFALQGARLVSVKRSSASAGSWMIEARPEKGAWEAGLVVPQEDVMMVFPLTLAPKINADLDRNGAVNEKDFSAYLKGKRRDLNGDGKTDYLDDYIFTANYLVSVSQKKTTAGETASVSTNEPHKDKRKSLKREP